MNTTARRWMVLAVLLAGLQAQGQTPAQVPTQTPTPPAASASAPTDCPPTAHAPTPEERTRAIEQARDRGFLWRISKGGRSSWLYGTIHIGRLEWMFPGPQVSAALRGSDVVAFELDITDSALMQRLQAAQTGSRNTPAPALPEDLADRLRTQLRVACAPPEMLSVLAPEMVGTALMMMSVRRDGLDASYGIDPALAFFARREGKSVVSLETPEQQMKLMRSNSSGELRVTLEKVLSDLEHDRARPLLLRVAQVWSEGQTAELERYREWCDCAATPHERATLKALLDDRNAPMAARIDKLHASGKTVFAAVGSLHMFGPAGLPAMLAKRGYRVERVAFKP